MSERNGAPSPTVVLVLGTMRSGSTWLGAVLGAHPGAATLGEFFKPFRAGTVICRLCEADGLAECSVLHGADAVAPADAYAFAAERLDARVLIDVSKRFDWYSRFVGRADLDVRLVHVLRHPAGYAESQLRRNPRRSHDELLAEWSAVNESIETFAAATRRPTTVVVYDELAGEPDVHFPPLCDALGLRWDAQALAYWTVPHHGLGANGAASAYLRGRSVVNFRTGDDAHYAGIAERPTAADERWRDRLPRAFVRRSIASPYARALARRLGRAPWSA